MSKNYNIITFDVGKNIEDAVKELLSYKEKEILVCGDFNGVTLYSDTVTLDKAYKDITGKTKSEVEKAKLKCIENYKREKREHKKRISSLSEKWTKKGREILTQDKWEYWNRIVPIRLDDIYHGMELGCCLDIINILNNNGTLYEAKEKIESQNHSGMSYGLVCSMVKEFCSRGQEFVEYME